MAVMVLIHSKAQPRHVKVQLQVERTSHRRMAGIGNKYPAFPAEETRVGPSALPLGLALVILRYGVEEHSRHDHTTRIR